MTATSASETKYVCVFCGSGMGRTPAYAEAARAFADTLVDFELGLVYGGAQRGLMGVLADRVLERGGQVVGVMPDTMIERELAHPRLTELVIVPSMHVRKAEMAARASAFVALPGGFGTLDELNEVVTWRQLGLHEKPIGMLEVAGYFAAFRSFMAHMLAEGFVAERHAGLLQVEDRPDLLLRALGFARYTQVR